MGQSLPVLTVRTQSASVRTFTGTAHYMEPRWLTAARKEIGLREIPGAKHNPRILKYWTLIRAPFHDDETPWCAGFVGGMLESVGIKSSRSAAARSYLKWGRKLSAPVAGCIVVFERGPKNGHVGFVTGTVKGEKLRVLGGNQGDAVNEKLFPTSRVLGYRWPAGEPLPGERIATVDGAGLETSDASTEGGPTTSHHKAPPVVVAEVEDDEPAASPAQPPKTGITEVNLTTGGLTIGGIAMLVWEQLQKAPQSIVDAVVKATERPTFWLAVAALAAVAYVGYRRHCQKCEGA